MCALGTPLKNGVEERRNQTLIDLVRWMIDFSSLPIFFWGYVLETVLYLPYLRYLKGFWGLFIYSQDNHKVFVSKSARFFMKTISNKVKMIYIGIHYKIVPLLHKILWIQRYKHMSFPILLVLECFLIVRGLYPTNYDEQ